jgi:hypothetical protein
MSNWWYSNPDVPPETLADWFMALTLPGLERIAREG